MKLVFPAIALVLITAVPAWSQTQAELEKVVKITKRVQTKVSSLLMLSGLAEGKGDYKKSKEYYNRILEIYKADPGVGTESPRYAYIIAKIGQCDNRVGEKEAARKKAKEALAMLDAQTTDNPKDHNHVLLTRQACAVILGKEMPAVKKAKAIPVPQLKTIPSSDIHDLEDREKQVKIYMASEKNKTSPEQMKRTLYLANVYTLGKKYAEAEPLFKKVIADIEKNSGKHSPQLLTPLSNYGFLLKQEGKQKEADEVLKRMQLMTGERK